MKKNRSLLILLSGMVIFAILLASCQVLIADEPSEEAVQTAAAETQQVIHTQTAVAELEQEATQMAQQLTAVADEPDPAETPEPTPTEPRDRCNWLRFVDDITIEDRTILESEEAFTKVWRLRNTGTCAWTPDYQIQFHSGHQLGAPTSEPINQAVQPGEKIDIAVDMVAPTTPGTYTGYWMLMDEQGQLFGAGENADVPFWVRIRVTDEDEFVFYHLAENYCQAGWVSSVNDNIACPSPEDIHQGFVQAIESPRLEDGKVYDEPSILTYPDSGESGYMVGRYPRMMIQEGDHFRATIGCLHDATSCNVNFTLRVLVPGVGFTTLGMWHEVYDGMIYPIDVDLSEYAGTEVEITLSAIAVDDTPNNYAIWVDPRIVRQAD